ncbi:class V lanthionine synthetase subunit LxmK [Streptomyces europaeiscabiei]|uniref:class V lanthionine synthetase subunit LxmK n=1 Tax=Streptomyces europaeiscabiei TaxID=146819 RepID=UPI000765C404|nr:class V lanthionine synthetase subunit LxmK [Streptomyces europaeiscabiei]MDX3668218.1 class V lanthionine synthetase subunit LxmK [Streptomyces europaeiscabiei]MDX3708927.1 class V lanthionine synthetase subunit LxmK [Streptomyces europaeiscabiei]MDX3864500.1 class V lanthionine synthetase subunit LxmK [Streptomyces europaeiscabiei]MDX3871418.1 class V lanthionine synthetase subunit LxmK [Streptomyces europaeiscabiei]
MTTDQASKPSLTRARFDPVQLDKVPEVGVFLERLGFGGFVAETVVAHVGRNDNWAGTTTSGAKVFVKRVGGEPNDVLRRFRRITVFEEIAARFSGTELRAPAFLGADEEHRLVAFEHLAEARSGSELSADESFDDALCRRAGRILGTLHALPVEPGTLDESPHPLPAIEDFEALTLPVFASSCFAEIESWALLQRDVELIDALRRLRQRELAAPKVAAHCDLRLDQYLACDGELYLTDWEEFRSGDAARDVGGFVGEWLYRVIQGIPQSISREPGHVFGQDASHEDILKHGALEIDRLRPRIQEFWSGYRETRPEADEDFTTRVAAFAGWHMLDRMLAGARYVARLTAGDRAAAGIGRTVLMAPHDFTSVLGLEGTS